MRDESNFFGFINWLMNPTGFAPSLVKKYVTQFYVFHTAKLSTG